MRSDVHTDDSSTLVLRTQAQSSEDLVHSLGMAETTTRATIARNVRLLRDKAGWSQSKLAKIAKIAQTAVSYIEKPDGKSPTVETLEAIACAFGVPNWTLLIPFENMDPKLLQALDKLVEQYAKLPDDGRTQVQRTSDQESRYAQAAKVA